MSQRFGGEISGRETSVLSRCPDPNGIVENIDAFNKEIASSYRSEFLVTSDREKEEAELTIAHARAKLGLIEPPKLKAKPVEKPVRNLSGRQPVRPQFKKEPVPTIKVQDIQEKEQVFQNKVREMSTERINKLEDLNIDFIGDDPKLMNDKSLDSVLEDFEEKVVEQERITEQSQDLTKSKVMAALSKIPGAPNEAKLNSWKSQLGPDAIHTFVFSEREIYIYRHLTRSQWNKIQELIQKMQSVKNVNEDDLKEKVVRHCILWPQPDEAWARDSRGGVLDALYQAILMSSYFLDTRAISLLTLDL